MRRAALGLLSVAAGNIGTSTPVNVTVTNTPIVTPPPAATASLRLTASGRTGVAVTSDPAGVTVASGQSRTASYEIGSSIRLTVGSGRTAVFSGACSTGGVARSSCTLTLQANSSVSATIR